MATPTTPEEREAFLILYPSMHDLLKQLPPPAPDMPDSWRGGFHPYAPLMGMRVIVSDHLLPPVRRETWRQRLDRRLRSVPIVVWATLYAAIAIRVAAHWAMQ